MVIRQIFQDSVFVKIYPNQNFVLYNIHMYITRHTAYSTRFLDVWFTYSNNLPDLYVKIPLHLAVTGANCGFAIPTHNFQ